MKQPWWKNTKGEWYVIIQFLLFALIIFGPKRTDNMSLFNLNLFGNFPQLNVILGLILGGVGGVLGFAGILSLGSNLTAVPHPKENSTFIQTGAYRWVRHPIYSGILFASLGWAFIVDGVFTFIYVFILFIFFDIKSHREELWLCAKFTEYPAYQKRVPKLIPLLY